MFGNWFKKKTEIKDMPLFANQAERNEVVNAVVFHSEESDIAYQNGKNWKGSRHSDKTSWMRKQYYARLPRRSFTRCPFCNHAYVQKIDPYGYDGDWWYSKGDPNRTVCEHYRLIRCATNLHGNLRDAPVGGDRNFGPAVPYVIPRLLQLPNMVCVVTAMTLEAGYTFYPLVYFSQDPIAEDSLTANWAGKSYGFEVRNEFWDFELSPWVQSGQLRWCSTTSDHNTILEDANPDQFPYLDLPGHRGVQTAVRSKFWQTAALGESVTHYSGD